VIRRLQCLIVAVVLLIAAFSDRSAFPLLCGLPRLLAVGGSYVLTRFGLADLEAGYRVDHRQGHVGDDLRTTYSISNASGLPKPWLEVYNPTDLPVPLPGRASGCGRGAALVDRDRSAHAAGHVSDRAHVVRTAIRSASSRPPPRSAGPRW